MAKKTPPLGARGRYTVKSPWTTNPGKLYTCVAIRSFSDIYELGFDVYDTYYVPMGLTNGTVSGGQTFSFNAEKTIGANIITLRSDDNDDDFIYIPDTYILSYPDVGEVRYSHMVLSASLGALPDYLDLASVKDAVRNVIAQHYGVVPTVNEHRAPSVSNPTRLQHESLEAARIGAITLLETDHAKYLRLQGQNLLLQNQINALTAILQTNNLLP